MSRLGCSLSSVITEADIEDFFAAAAKGDITRIRHWLGTGCYPNIQDKRFRTAVLFAAQNDQEEAFFELVKAGADLHLNQSGRSVLEAAVCHTSASGLRMVRAVLEGGLKHSDGLASAFNLACRYGNSEVVLALLAAGADVNHEYQPLFSAVENNLPKVVEILLKQGARTNIRLPRDEFGSNKFYKKTPLEIALIQGYSEIVALLEAAGATVPVSKNRRVGPTSVVDSWKRMGKWLKRNAPDWKPMCKKASQSQIAKAQDEMGIIFPDDLKESYGCHNGSDEDGGIFPVPDGISFQLLPLDQVVLDWHAWKDLIDKDEFNGREPKSDKGIRSDWWNIGWIPFAGNGGGDFLCVDSVPDDSGTCGQVITMNHESGEHRLVATSFREWLSSFADDLEAGKFEYEEGVGLV